MAKLGNVMKAYIKVSNAYTWLTGEQSNSVNITAEAIEVSDKSTVWAQFIPGKKGATIEVTVFADNTDPAQKEALDSIHAGDTVDIFVGTLSSNSPTSGDAGTGIVTSVSDTNDFGAVSTRSISITASGELTHYDSAE